MSIFAAVAPSSVRLRLAVCFTFAALASSVFSQTTAAPRRLRDVVPGDALFYLDAPDFQSTLKRGKDIALAKIIREEEFQQFLTPAWTQLRDHLNEMLKHAGEKPEDWQTCPFKSFEISFGKVDARGNLGIVARAVTGKLGGMLRKFAQENPSEFRREDVNGDVILGPPDRAEVPNMAIGLSGDSLCLFAYAKEVKTSAFDGVKQLMQSLKAGDVKGNLASDANFTSLTSKLQSKNPEWTIYLRPSAALEEITALATRMAGGDAAEPGASKPATSAGRRPSRRDADEVAQVVSVVKIVAKELGISSVTGVALAESYSPGTVTTEMVVANDPSAREGAGLLSSTKPLDRALIERAYDGVDAFSVSSIDLKAAYTGILNALTGVNTVLGPIMDREFPVLKALATYEKEHNLKIGEDFFGSMGSQTYAYSFPPKAGSAIPLPDNFFAVRLQDKAKFERCLKEFLTSAQSVEAVKLDTSEGTAGRPTVYSLSIEPESGMMGGGGAQLAPLLQQVGLSIAILDDWALLGMNPVAMKNELRKLSKPRDASAEVKKLFAEVPADATAFSYHDWKPTIRSAWDMLASFASLAGEVEEVPLNLQEIPTSQSLVKHLKPTYSYTVATKTGSYTKSVGSFGFEVLGGAVGLGAGVAMYARMESAHGMEPVTFEVDPDEGAAASAPAGGGNAAASTRATLKKVEVGVNVYRAEKGQYPESLTILLKPNDDHPQGYLIGFKDLPADAWGNALIYVRAADGSSFKLRSAGPNGMDDAGEGDDIR
jgi:hypothetical protein